MTVGEMKKVLENFKDDTLVVVTDSYGQGLEVCVLSLEDNAYVLAKATFNHETEERIKKNSQVVVVETGGDFEFG